MFLLARLSACHVLQVEELARLPLGDGDLVALFPPDGALRLFGQVPVQVVLGGGAAGEVPSVALSRDGDTDPLSCTLIENGNVADCGVIPDVPTDHDGIALSVSAGDETMSAVALGRLPTPGLGWSLLEGTTFRRLGGNTDVLPVVNAQLATSSSAFLALDGYNGAPGDYTMVAGPSGLQPDGGLAIAAPGLTFVVPVEVDDEGSVRGSTRAAWLPLPVNGERAYLLLLDVEVTGKLYTDVLDDLVVNADLPAIAVQALASSLGSGGNQVLELVRFDVDRDGDGEGDAARVELAGSPAPATLEAWATLPESR
ncbi:MAG: hypothetical protein ABMA64_06510 [Myxococcota bacterium]